jgi:hypothetical protein
MWEDKKNSMVRLHKGADLEDNSRLKIKNDVNGSK